MKLISAALLALLVATPALAVPPTQMTDQNGNPVGTATSPLSITTPPGSPLASSDPNNAAYSAASATFATGATVTPGRGIYLNCSAAGSVTLSLSGGGSLVYPVTVSGVYVLPFAVTGVSADSASCTHQTVN